MFRWLDRTRRGAAHVASSCRDSADRCTINTNVAKRYYYINTAQKDSVEKFSAERCVSMLYFRNTHMPYSRQRKRRRLVLVHGETGSSPRGGTGVALFHILTVRHVIMGKTGVPAAD
jgi:hypothetical protein